MSTPSTPDPVSDQYMAISTGDLDIARRAVSLDWHNREAAAGEAPAAKRGTGRAGSHRGMAPISLLRHHLRRDRAPARWRRHHLPRHLLGPADRPARSVQRQQPSQRRVPAHRADLQRRADPPARATSRRGDQPPRPSRRPRNDGAARSLATEPTIDDPDARMASHGQVTTSGNARCRHHRAGGSAYGRAVDPRNTGQQGEAKPLERGR